MNYSPWKCAKTADFVPKCMDYSPKKGGKTADFEPKCIDYKVAPFNGVTSMHFGSKSAVFANFNGL